MVFLYNNLEVTNPSTAKMSFAGGMEYGKKYGCKEVSNSNVISVTIKLNKK